MPDWYVLLSEKVSPVAFSLGGFDVRWYALSYLAGFFGVWAVVAWRVRRGEITMALGDLWDLGAWVFFGGILGGRIGWTVLYGKVSSVSEFLSSFLPWDAATGVWTGWYGMSFFGAMFGAVFFGLLTARIKKISFLDAADAVAPALPIGIFFGRVGNFLNGELVGKETDSFLGMSVGGSVRHPSQLYEAILEGLVLFFLLWRFRKMRCFPGSGLAFLGMGYGAMRFFAEFFRNEDAYIWFLTQGQMYAGLLFAGCGLWVWWGVKKYGTLRARRSIKSESP